MLEFFEISLKLLVAIFFALSITGFLGRIFLIVVCLVVAYNVGVEQKLIIFTCALLAWITNTESWWPTSYWWKEKNDRDKSKDSR